MAVGKRSLVHGPVLEEDRGKWVGVRKLTRIWSLGFVLFFHVSSLFPLDVVSLISC